MAERRQIKTIGLTVARVVIAGVFLYAGAVKALDPAGFVSDINGYRLLPYRMAVITAVYLPWLEIVCGVLLLGRRFCYHGALVVLSCLLSGFTIALASAWFRGLDVTCGCFGTGGGHTKWGWSITRNLLLLALIVVAWFANPTMKKSLTGPEV